MLLKMAHQNLLNQVSQLVFFTFMNGRKRFKPNNQNESEMVDQLYLMQIYDKICKVLSEHPHKTNRS